MGVPALFRWLSRKYPRIVRNVEEEKATTMETDDGPVEVPVNITGANPNGTEFDNLYLDMNGIVHPCTHPEGKPAPETEEEMMVEIFNYTERVVNMVRPRRVLFMAIDGVAPRAKMNQQRSRRFRAAQEAKDKAEAHEEALHLWKELGQGVDPGETKKAWDSNAITPGTPFMDLLAASLRYWVVQKLNTDPGWKNLQVYISDAGVPGEGEHKIMDFIRRQRVNKGYDANTKHVIYGLDADLIMLALATHEPNFRVLREDVFQQANMSACRRCGEEGHYAAECKNPQKVTTSSEPKPFIFLDVAVLREYLEVELNVPNTPFAFNFEQALDDWVLLIFFVGNDFLPHLPSLEIREGAIDTLLKIWKQELPRMGGYVTNNGQLQLKSVQIILEGLAQREDDIFRRRQENEERMANNQRDNKRRRVEASTVSSRGPSAALRLTEAPSAAGLPAHPSLPAKPGFAQSANALGLGAKSDTDAAVAALGGSNHDVVANRAAIRMANMSAAEMLKAEMAGLTALKPSTPTSKAQATAPTPKEETVDMDVEGDVPGFGASDTPSAQLTEPVPVKGEELTTNEVMNNAVDGPRGQKRKQDEVTGDDSAAKAEDGDGAIKGGNEDVVTIPEEDEEPDADPSATDLAVGKMQVNADGSVVQEDKVKLYEPGYRDRYYRQKFGVEPSDEEFRKKVTKCYVEGMAWVLHYYYQGTPSWQWYFPYHFAPFAHDFQDIEKMDLKFDVGAPFKPFEQLMGVFPTASKSHIPTTFHQLMTDENSPIIDFYPEIFEIDMNGKKMLWQGVALLPFIDETRLLSAMAGPYEHLTEDEKRRNSWGNNVVFIGADHPLYPSFEALYGKRKNKDPVPMDVKASEGINGTLEPNRDCLPGSTYYSPLESVGLPDIRNDRSLSAIYYFPKQLAPHRSVILPGAKRLPRVLTQQDLETARRKANGDDGGRGGRGGRGDRSGRGRGMFFGGSGYQIPSSGPGPHNGGSNRGRGERDSRPQHNHADHGPPQSYGGHNQYGAPQSSYGYGGGRGGGGGPGGFYGGPPHRGGAAGYGGAPAAPSYGGGGGYGGYGGGPPQSYGGVPQGGYGGPPPPRNDYGGYGGNSTPAGGYGGGYSNPRGGAPRGRGGRF